MLRLKQYKYLTWQSLTIFLPHILHKEGYLDKFPYLSDISITSSHESLSAYARDVSISLSNKSSSLSQSEQTASVIAFAGPALFLDKFNVHAACAACLSGIKGKAWIDALLGAGLDIKSILATQSNAPNNNRSWLFQHITNHALCYPDNNMLTLSPKLREDVIFW